MNYLQWGTSMSLSQREALSGSEHNCLGISETKYVVLGSWSTSGRTSSKICEFDLLLSELK